MPNSSIGTMITLASIGALLVAGCASTGGADARWNGNGARSYNASPSTWSPSQPGGRPGIDPGLSFDPGVYLKKAPQVE